MPVREIRPTVERDVLLPGAQFVDAFCIGIGDRALDARTAAVRMIEQGPSWIGMLMRLRNLIVAPFGLKTPTRDRPAHGDTIGIFPVRSETPQRIVAGFDDSHLDFRVVIDVEGGENGRRVVASTLVRTNNRIGRIYLATIMPFHRAVVRAMLRQLAD
ncbi:DUF2867 domain-containing protein [Rhodopseudomonas sp. HC1]|uniref:DUF2867 domain-containing protein n=1 Tax=Rhodopseudomonas infernalis TaxID=2897386 RepID=UPI001EE7AE62|nr:DUF2867 domain-containing protein [Rhodopseudomonas infernalis]MCG6206629.1 DUF2867 domain-containing protein [Rhodopseudomonas infernalis]